MARKRRPKPVKKRESDDVEPKVSIGALCLSKTPSLVLTSTVFLAHAVGLMWLFNPIGGLFDTRPLVDQDWGLHFHHLCSLEAFWRQDHKLWGYNPFFMAGYPANTIQDLSIKLFELVAIGLSSISLAPVQWFKLCAFFATASAPWLAFFAARNFFFGFATRDTAAATAALLATIYWWNSLPREMFFYGMIGFPVACYLSLFGVSLFYRLGAYREKLGAIHLAWLIFAVAILPLHIQSVVIFLPPMIVVLLNAPAPFRRRLLTWAVGAAVLALLINGVWLLPAFDHRGDDVSSAVVEQLPLFASTNPLTFILDYLGPRGFWTFRPSFIEKGFRLAILLLGALGIRRVIQSGQRTLGITLATGVAVLFLIAYFGALAPALKAWQPLRFKVALDLFLVIGAAYAVSQFLIASRNSRSRLIPVVLACGVIAFAINLLQTESTGKLQLRSRLDPQLQRVVDWIAGETPADARLLFEESGDETGFVYDGVYLSSLLPNLTGRQLIGGPINLYNDRHHFAEFHSGRIFQKDIQSLSDSELRSYLRLYNIGAIIAFHPASLQRLGSIPGLVTVEQRIGPLYLMKVNQPLSWFIAGEGAVKAGFNRLELAQLKGNEVILKYHWVRGLNAIPSTRIEPVRMADDPIPFIKLTAPPTEVTLRVGTAN
jgi:hypothetical protein